MNATQLIEAYVDDVVRHVERKQRNDVGVELRTLLGDELSSQARTAERPADEEMAMDLLRRFGRPEDVAIRYRKPGFPVIDAADTPLFVRLTVIGMGIIWILGAFATADRPGGTGHWLPYWYFKYGLAAFWWPGFLVACTGLASWVKRRFPVTDDWKPRVIDRDRINRPASILAMAGTMVGTIWLTAPAQFVRQLTGERLPSTFYDSLIYDPGFTLWQLPLLLVLMVCGLIVHAAVLGKGRWQPVTRRLELGLSAAMTVLLGWSITTGHIFQSDASDEIAKGAIALVLLFVLWDIAAKVSRELARVRVPSELVR
jgi:hypothetical protein